MKNEFTLEAARNLNDAQILAALTSALSLAADGIFQACIAVCVARERGIELQKLPAVFKYATDIAEGRLSARAAMTLARFPFTVKAVLAMDHAMQERLADGEKVKVAVKVNGRIQSADRTIWEMTQMQMRVAFADGQIVPWEQQGEWLHKSGYSEPVKQAKPPRYDKKAGQIVIDRKRYAVEDFHQCFAEAGLRLVPIYETKRARLSAVPNK